MQYVALLAEGVDRNLPMAITRVTISSVALLAEGVDRNFEFINVKSENGRSPSSRRAWIEILRP